MGDERTYSYTVAIRAVTSSDAMTAWLTLRLPMGGQAVDPRRVIQSLQDHGVVYGLQIEALRTALTSGHCEHLVVAVGCPAGHGERTRFVNLVEDRMADARGDSSELARVDYRAMGHLHLVDRGVQLMRRIPASQGVPGMNVLGQAVAAVPVPDLPFERGLSGVDVASNDPDVLVSTLAGAPSFLEKGVKVLPVIEVDEVGLDSGHIEFDGTLHVKGDIRAGMRVVAGGDVVELAGVFVALGVAGSTALARKIGAAVENGRIVTDEKMQTTVPGLYAAGDCTGGLLQVAKAVYEGALAGTEAAKALRKG